MPAGASSGVFDVTTGSGVEGVFGESSEGVAEGVAEGATDGKASGSGMLELPHDHGAYQDPYRTDDAVRRPLGGEMAPVLQLAACMRFVRHVLAEREVRGNEENCTRRNSQFNQYSEGQLRAL
jgi:hypothetical protein